MFSLCEKTYSQIAIIPKQAIQNVSDEGSNPSIKDFQEAMKQYSKWVENFSNEDIYKDVEIKDSLTGETTKFKDMSDLEKNLFYLWQAEICSNKMASLDLKWYKNFKAAKTSEEGSTESSEENLDRTANKKDIFEFGSKLKSLRKNHALNFEKFVKEFFKKYESDIPLKDREAYLERIHDWHISTGLVKEDGE
jgi:hypothetical protein